MAVRITCINKEHGYHDDPHVAIENLGWTDEATGKQGKSTRLEIYNWLKEGGEAYVKDRFGFKPLVVAETDEFVAIATEEIALRRALGNEFMACEPAPGTMRAWSVANAGVQR